MKNNDDENGKWRKDERTPGDKITPISSFRDYKNSSSKYMNIEQLKALQNATSFPINMIGKFQMYLNMSKITETTPIYLIIQNKHLNWDKNIIANKIDVKMINTVNFPDVKWNYKNLTLDESNKCNIVKNPNLPWCNEAIESINMHELCPYHLILFLNKYQNLNLNWIDATRIIELDIIIINSSLKWNFDILNDKLEESNDINIKQLAILSLPSKLINWKVMTNLIPLEFISKYPNLPWDYYNKIFCKHCKDCGNCISLNILKKIKNQNLNWDKITILFDFEVIYANQNLQWSETKLIELKAPIWFIRKINYKWDMRYVTSYSKQKWNIIMENLDIKWDLEELVNDNDNDNDNIIPVEILEIYKDLKWNWDKYSDIIIFSKIQDYHHLPWNWNIIKNRKDIPIDGALSFPEKDWVFENFLNLSNDECIKLKILIELKKSFNLSISLLIFNKM